MDINAINNSSDPKGALIKQVQQETAMNNFQKLFERINHHCFEKCIPAPGSSLSKKDESCISMCMDKYMQTWNTVSRQYISRIEQKVQSGQGGVENLSI
ncbi:protein translocase subunit [Lecanora helva]